MPSTWTDPDNVNAFTASRRHIPCIDWLFDAAERLVRNMDRPPRTIVDLGAGSGVTGAALLARYPQAQLVLVDHSGPMLDKARAQHGEDARVSVVDADLSEAGVITSVCPEPVDLVVSSFAIHHVQRPRQRELYGEVFQTLRPGGLFVNIEHVASATPRVESIHWRWFCEHVTRSRQAAGEQITLPEVEAESVARRDENILTDVFEQVRWLREIGFVDVDCVFKAFELSVFGGWRGSA